MCTDCNQPTTVTPCSNPCNKCGGCVCTCSSLYDNVGCINITSSDCVNYIGLDISCVGIKRNDNFSKIINTLSSYASNTLSRINSSSLSLVTEGTCGDQLKLELIPSTNLENILTYGTDGRPYVPRTDVSLVSTTCLSWQKTVNGTVITYVPIIDWNCISQQVCPLCDNPAPCDAPTGLVLNSTGQTTAQLGWNSVAGVTYDVLVNGVVQATNVNSPYTFNSLVPNTTYSLTIRAKCSSGATADTSLSVTTLPITSCILPSGMSVSIAGGTANITWTPGGGGGTQAVEYKLLNATTYTQYSTVQPTATSVSIPGLSPNLVYMFRITNNCGGGTASATTRTGIEITCPTITSVVTDTSVVASFAPLGGDIDSYVVNLYESTGTTILQTQTFTGPFDVQINATFIGLTASTSYLVEVRPAAGSTIRTNCTRITATTTVTPGCPLPTNLTVTIS